MAPPLQFCYLLFRSHPALFFIVPVMQLPILGPLVSNVCAKIVIDIPLHFASAGITATKNLIKTAGSGWKSPVVDQSFMVAMFPDDVNNEWEQIELLEYKKRV